MNERLEKEEYKILKKELKESKFTIVCTEKVIWLYGEVKDIADGIIKIIKMVGEKNE